MLKYLVALFCIALLIGACNDTSNIGEQLLSDEKLDLSYLNNFSIGASTIVTDVPISYTFTKTNLGETNLITPETGIIGELDDPKFGKIKSSIYSKIIYNPNLAIPIFKNLKFDSSVLVMAYDTLGNYGDKNAEHTLLVEQIDEDYMGKDTIYTTQKLATKRIIGQKTFIPNSKDSIRIDNHKDGTKQKLAAQIRVRLDDEWAKELYTNPVIKDGPTDDSNGKLYSIFNGIKISSTCNKKALLGINLNPQSISSSGISRLTFYFTSDTTKIEYSFYFSFLKFNNFEIDRQGSVVDQFIDQPEKSDSIIFLQSLDGPGFYLELKDLSVLKNKIINHASIEMTVADIVKDLKPVTQLIASKKENGKYVVIKDVEDLVVQGYPLALGFGGLITGTTNQTYSINITKHLKELVKEETLDRKIYITANNRSIRPNRSVLYGPKHSKYPIRLKVVFSE
jgi:hypothetical protein